MGKNSDSESPSLPTIRDTLNNRNFCNVEALLSRRRKQEGCYYLIKWCDLPTEKSTWEHESRLLDYFSSKNQLREEQTLNNTLFLLHTFDKIDAACNMTLEEKALVSLKKQIQINSRNKRYFQELLEKLVSSNTSPHTKDCVLLFCLDLFEPNEANSPQPITFDEKRSISTSNYLKESSLQDDSTTASESDDVSDTESISSAHTTPSNSVEEKTIFENSTYPKFKESSNNINDPIRTSTRALKILTRSKTKGGKVKYQVYWSNGTTSWVPTCKLNRLMHLIEEYEHIQFTKHDSGLSKVYDRRRVPNYKPTYSNKDKADLAVTTFSDIDTESDWSETDDGISDTNFKLYLSNCVNKNDPSSLHSDKEIDVPNSRKIPTIMKPLTASLPVDCPATFGSYTYLDNSTTDESSSDQDFFTHNKSILPENVHNKKHKISNAPPQKPNPPSPRPYIFPCSLPTTKFDDKASRRNTDYSNSGEKPGYLAEHKTTRTLYALDNFNTTDSHSPAKEKPLLSPGSSQLLIGQEHKTKTSRKNNGANMTAEKSIIAVQGPSQTRKKKLPRTVADTQISPKIYVGESIEPKEIGARPSESDAMSECSVIHTEHQERDGVESGCCYVCDYQGTVNVNLNYSDLASELGETLISCNRCSFVAHKKCICSVLGDSVLSDGVRQQEVLHSCDSGDSGSESADEKPLVTSVITVWCCHDCVRWPHDVQKILTYRNNGGEPISQESQGISKLESCATREFLVKFKGLSYHKLAWVPSRWLRDVAPIRCRQFEKKSAGPQEVTDIVKTQWYYVDEILDARLNKPVATASPKDATKIYAKWKDLPYEESTWEEPPDSESIYYTAYVSAFYRYIEAAKIQPYTSTANLPSFKELHSQPPFISNGKLMKHQLDGLNWLLYKWTSRSSCILADDMGLGKTIQIISFLSVLYNAHSIRNFLVVVPNSVAANWLKEFNKWAPNLIVTAYYGTNSNRGIVRQYKLFGNNSHERPQLKCHVVVTTYETMISDTDIFNRIKPWEVLVVDEGHRLKNENSRLFVQLNKLTFRHKILLTGTPLQNDMDELFNLMSFIDPNMFSRRERMSVEYQKLTKARVEELHDMLKPYFLRRTKGEVLGSLPKKSEVIVPVGMSSVQKELYKGILSRNHDLLKSILGVGKPLGPIRKTTLVNTLMELRKCLNHPYLLDGVEEMEESAKLVQERLIEASAKLSLLHLLLPKLKQGGHRVLIFSQMTRMLDILEDYLAYEGYKYCRLDGNTPSDLRQQLVDSFNEPGSELFIFLLSTRAGGVGLNLASADTVIIYDPDFNPHADIQALSRAHRIGQEKQVLVLKFVTRGSAEERILQIGKKKMVMDHLIIERMDNEDMNKSDVDNILKFGAKALFAEDIEPEQAAQTTIKYDENAINSLLLRSAEDTEIDEVGMESNGFGFAKIWSGDSTVLQEDDENYWVRILKNRLAKAEAKETVRYGRGSRKRSKMIQSSDEIIDSVNEVSPSYMDEGEESNTSFSTGDLVTTNKPKAESVQKKAPRKRRRVCNPPTNSISLPPCSGNGTQENFTATHGLHQTNPPESSALSDSLLKSNSAPKAPNFEALKSKIKFANSRSKSSNTQPPVDPKTAEQSNSQSTSFVSQLMTSQYRPSIASPVKQQMSAREEIYARLTSIGAYDPFTKQLLVSPYMMPNGEVKYYAPGPGYMDMQQMLAYVHAVKHKVFSQVNAIPSSAQSYTVLNGGQNNGNTYYYQKGIHGHSYSQSPINPDSLQNRLSNTYLNTHQSSGLRSNLDSHLSLQSAPSRNLNLTLNSRLSSASISPSNLKLNSGLPSKQSVPHGQTSAQNSSKSQPLSSTSNSMPYISSHQNPSSYTSPNLHSNLRSNQDLHSTWQIDSSSYLNKVASTTPYNKQSSPKLATFEDIIVRRLSSGKGNICLLCFITNHTHISCPFRQDLAWLVRQFSVIASINSAKIPRKTFILNLFKYYMSLGRKTQSQGAKQSGLRRSEYQYTSSRLESRYPTGHNSPIVNPLDQSSHTSTSALSNPPTLESQNISTFNSSTIQRTSLNKQVEHSDILHGHLDSVPSTTESENLNSPSNDSTNSTRFSRPDQISTTQEYIVLDSSSEESDISPKNSHPSDSKAEEHPVTDNTISKQLDIIGELVAKAAAEIQPQSTNSTVLSNSSGAKPETNLDNPLPVAIDSVEMRLPSESSSTTASNTYNHLQQVETDPSLNTTHVENENDSIKPTDKCLKPNFLDSNSQVSTPSPQRSLTPESKSGVSFPLRKPLSTNICRSPRKRGTIIPIPTNKPRKRASCNPELEKNQDY